MPSRHARTRQRCIEIREQVRHLPGVQVSQVLTAAEVADAAERLGLRWRQRVFTPFVTLWLFLWQALSPAPSCREAVLRLLNCRQMQGEGAISGHTGGYCRARQRLSYEFILALIQMVAEKLRASGPACALWCGRRVKIVDVSMADTAANQARFPQQRGQQPGLGFPIAGLLGVFCWSSGALLAHASSCIKGKNNSELGLLRTLLDRFSPGEVMLGDRYYASYFMIASFAERGVDVVLRQHQRRKTDFRRGEPLGRDDHIAVWEKPKRPDWLDESLYERLPERLRIRELKAGHNTLVTTLLDPQSFRTEALRALYQTRWHCELDLRAIKQVLGMEVWSRRRLPCMCSPTT